MTAFKKFDPHAFLEREQRTPDSPVTLASLATLAAPPPENEIRDVGFNRVINGGDQQDKNQNWTSTPAKVAKVAKVQPDQNWTTTPAKVAKVQPAALCPHPYRVEFDALERRCPDLVPDDRWRQAVEDGRQFLAAWGMQAHALGWTAQELFGLCPIPANPRPFFDRLSRYDLSGLIWFLGGRPVVSMTTDSAAIRAVSGGAVVYRKHNKPALGPLGDTLDDMGTAT